MIARPARSCDWTCAYCGSDIPANYAHKCREYDAARERVFVNGDAGDAIDYALGHINNPKAKIGFLDDWRDGRDLDTRWPGYIRWVKVQREGASAMSASGQDRETGLEAKPASAIGEAETPKGHQA